MSLPRSETTLRKDDEAKGRETRRRTPSEETRARQRIAWSLKATNETIRRCMKFYKGHAWSLSLMDTITISLERHHKLLSKFIWTGSSMEASSSSKVSGNNNNDETAANGEPKPKNMKTTAKNKETLNAPLDKEPLPDPILGKFNSTQLGSIYAPNRLMHNILPTVDSELKLRTNYRFWNSEELPGEVTDYTKVDPDMVKLPDHSLVNAEWVGKLGCYDKGLKLRPLHTGYIITDTPNPPKAEEPTAPQMMMMMNDDDMGVDNADDFFENPKELSDSGSATDSLILEIDYNELEELGI